ncbi:MAG TPA: trypsin-like peptidase domain-containing protein [Candidatus Limnocylindrales bacterium]
MDQPGQDTQQTTDEAWSRADTVRFAPPPQEPGAGPWRPQFQPASPEPWTATPPPAPRDGGRPDPRIVRVALLAAVLSAVLTSAMSFALFRLTTPAVVDPGASSGPSSAVAAVAPTIAPTATTAPVATTAPTPTPPVATPAGSGTPGSSTQDNGGSVVAAVAKAVPTVVTITSEVGTGRRAGTGVGSGFVFDSGGWILTNAHVVDGATSISVALADGRQLPGQVYGVSSTTDLAVVKVDATELSALAIGDSNGLALGQAVIAIGSPLGEYPDSVTTGVVSGLNRSISIRHGENLDGLIQTDAAINPGNSGGPLLDLSGRVVGIDTATDEGAQGVSFAIPIEAARTIMADALAGTPIP